MSPADLELLILAMMATPLATAAAILLLARVPNLREGATLLGAAALFAQAVILVGAVAGGARPTVVVGALGPGLDISLSVEPLGAMFAAIASGLWILNSLYSIGYMRGNGEANQTRFYVCFAIAIFGAMGVALAGDLLTLFVAYEVLTLSTYPLVAHKGDEKARRGARIYLSILLATSLGLLLPAILATWAVAGGWTFAPGGLMPDDVSNLAGGVILVLFAFGIGKAALMPVHAWLPNAMVAPTPVSALLHAVAVVKAGVFTMLKVSVYVFGPDVMQRLPAADGLAAIAGVSIVLASVIAMTKDNLKARLAFSTVSQLSYVTLGAMLATPAALMGAALQILMHAFGKITLFMAAGAIYTGAHKTEISTMSGLGRMMPWTYGAFAIGAFSIIGLPPLGGAWPKFSLVTGAFETGAIWLAAALAISSILNVAYLLAPIARGFFGPEAEAGEAAARADDHIHRPPLLTVIPPVLTAIGCVVLFFAIDPILGFLAPVFEPAPATGGVP